MAVRIKITSAGANISSTLDIYTGATPSTLVLFESGVALLSLQAGYTFTPAANAYYYEVRDTGSCGSVLSLSCSPPATTIAPTTTTIAPTTMAPTTMAPTTMAPTTMAPTTMAPTTMAPSQTTTTTTKAETTTTTTKADTTSTTSTTSTTTQALAELVIENESSVIGIGDSPGIYVGGVAIELIDGTWPLGMGIFHGTTPNLGLQTVEVRCYGDESDYGIQVGSSPCQLYIGTGTYTFNNVNVADVLNISLKYNLCAADTTSTTTSTTTIMTLYPVTGYTSEFSEEICDGSAGTISDVYSLVQNDTLRDHVVYYYNNGDPYVGSGYYANSRGPLTEFGRFAGVSAGEFIFESACTTTSTSTSTTSTSSTTTTSTTIECPSCYYYDLYCDGVEGQSSVFDIVECDGTIIEQSVPYEVSPMTFCLQSDPVIRPLGVSGHFVKGEICGNVCDTTTTTTTIPCATIESYLGYHDTSPIDACSASTLSYWGDVSVFADCTILYRDQFCTLLAYDGYYSDGLISRYWTGTEFSGLDTSCLDICYKYDLYCDGVEGQSSLFSYRDCTGQYEEQTVPFEASPWTLCSTVLPQSIGAVPGHVMGGSIPCTTTTTTTIPCATIESYLGYHDTSPIDACSASTLSYWGDVSVFADCTILYRDQFCTLLAYDGYYSDGLISRYWTGTEFSGLDTSCLDICYKYDLYCDGVEGQSSLFSYRDCTGQYEEQTVPFEASPWTLCSTVLPQSIGAVPGHVMGGSIPCTTTTTTTELPIEDLCTTSTTTFVPTTTTTTTTCDPSKCDYGLLYNWYAVNTGKLAPTDWHVPTDTEWATLTTWLTDNGYGYEGSGNDIAKSMAATSNWNSSSTPGTPGNDLATNNSSGFSGLPGGSRYSYGSFDFIGSSGYWWSSTETSASTAWYRHLYYDSTLVTRYDDNKEIGFSVRCLRDTYEGWKNDVPVVDYDGNEYDVVEIGTQLWLVQNLKTTHYNDGEAIPNITDNSTWAALTTGALCAYNNDWETYACVPEPTTTTSTTTNPV